MYILIICIIDIYILVKITCITTFSWHSITDFASLTSNELWKQWQMQDIFNIGVVAPLQCYIIHKCLIMRAKKRGGGVQNIG